MLHRLAVAGTAARLHRAAVAARLPQPAILGPLLASSGQHQRRCLTKDGYIHETVIPTYHFQKSLPKLPLPKLDETLDRYVNSAEAVVSAEQLAQTKEAVAAFKAGAGPKYHAELERLNKNEWKDSSFINQFWLDKYLEDRVCLPINYNPQLTFQNDPNPAKMEQAARAASLIYASIGFYRTLRDKQLEPDLFHTKPDKSKTDTFNSVVKRVPEFMSWYAAFAAGCYALDMSQYGRLFHSTRIPETGKDRLESFPGSRHVVVQRGLDFFELTVLNEDGTAVDHAQVEADLRAIIAAPTSALGPAVALFTTMDRDAWAAARATVQLDRTNAASLRKIDSALFMVTLEDAPIPDLQAEAKLMLHGDGRNRWFDKSFQLLINSDGRSALNFEHSWGDGVAVLRYFNEVFAESNLHAPLAAANLPAPSAGVEPLGWNLDAATAATLEKAGEDFDAFRHSIELQILETKAVSPKYLKSKKIGGDGTYQMGFQLAHYKMYGFSASTYESASTAGFKKGRTETIRSATPPSDTFCKTMTDPAATNADKVAAMRAAVDRHGAITKDALMGKGWDRHLFALRRLAEQENLSEAIFADKTYADMSNIIMSTSTLSSPALDGGGFGPVGPECYGIMYGSTGDTARFGVMSYFRDTERFIACLDEAFNEMREVLENEGE